MDQRIGSYSTKTKSPKWTRVAFAYVLDTTRVNASTVFSLSFDLTTSDLDSYELLWDLAESLVLPLAQIWRSNGLSVKTRMKSLLLGSGCLPAGGSEEDASAASATAAGRKQRCHLCLKALAGKPGYKQQKDRLPKVDVLQQMRKGMLRSTLVRYLHWLPLKFTFCS